MLLDRSIASTSATLDEDASAYQHIWNPLVSNWQAIEQAFLGPLRLSPLLSHPFAAGRFGLQALLSARRFTDLHFHGPRARALFAGISAHSILPLEQMTSAAAGLLPLDKRLERDAVAQGKQTVGLETMEFQINAIAGLPEDVQVSLLKATDFGSAVCPAKVSSTLPSS